MMLEALDIMQDIRCEVKAAPPSLQAPLADIAARVETVLTAALPRAVHGSRLAHYQQKLQQQKPAHSTVHADINTADINIGVGGVDDGSIAAQAQDIAQELHTLLAHLHALRHKTYLLLGDAIKLDYAQTGSPALHDALLEVTALEEVYGAVSGSSVAGSSALNRQAPSDF